MNQNIRKREICDCIVINTLVEVVFVSDKGLLQAVIPVKHTCHTVEAEAIDMIFLHPVFAVRKEEVFCLVLAIVKAARTPRRMVSLPAVVEVHSLGSVEETESLCLVVN